MSIWWVNTGARFRAQKQAGALWCPNHTVLKDGSLGPPQWHWSIIQNVRAGEFVLVARDGFVEAIALAKQAAIPDSQKPDTFPDTDSWHSIGWLLPVDFLGFNQRISRNAMAHGLFRYRARKSPFFVNKNGVLEGNQVYFAELPGADASEFFERIRQALEMQRPGDLDRAMGKSVGGEDSDQNPNTTREALIQARVGQGKFRQALVDMWDGKCCATGLSEPRLLRASHIVAWSSSTDTERLNPFNGLLLSAAYDAAFDNHLITLSAEGKWENVAGLSAEELEKAGLGNLEQQSVNGLHSGHHGFLARHRRNAHEKWRTLC